MSASASSSPACPAEELKTRVAKQLDLVGLTQWAGKYAHELSGGMQQRVGLARAFATEAPILLMDEPFSALDPLIRTKLQDELLQLQKTLKKTIIFVSHDLEEALKIGSTITIMEGGRIVQSGKPEDIVLRPANDYVREFIANVNPLSVLTAWHVMRDARDLEKAGDGWLWLDRRKTTRFKLDKDNTVIDAERNGQKSTWVSCDQAEDAVDESQHPVFWANPGTSLRTVMLAMHKSHTAPVGLFDDQSRFVGAIGVQGCAAGGVAAGGVSGACQQTGIVLTCRQDQASFRRSKCPPRKLSWKKPPGNFSANNFQGLKIVDVIVNKRIDYDNDEVIDLNVIYDGKFRAADVRSMGSAVRLFRPQLEKIGETAFPLFSFISSDEVPRRKRA